MSLESDKAALGQLIDGATHWRVSYRRGQVIYDEGDPAQSIYRVDTGCVRLQINGLEGRRQIITFMFPGEVFGLSLARTTSAEAVTASDLTRYSLNSVITLAAASTEVTVQLISVMDAMVNDLAKHVSRVAHLPASERLIWFFEWIIEHRGAAGSKLDVQLPMSHRDIADYLGLTPETLSRGFKKLQRQGVLLRKSAHAFTFIRRKFTVESISETPRQAPKDPGQKGLALAPE